MAETHREGQTERRFPCSGALLRRMWRGSHGGRDQAGPMVAGNLGDAERNKAWAVRARVHPQPRTGGPDGWSGRGLTLPEMAAYRWPVTWCRPVPHVHGEVQLAVGGRCQPRRCRSAGVDVPEHHQRKAREQAYVSAEQPSSPQDPRFPPAHAHPRRPLHPVCSSPQGSQEPGRLTARFPGRPSCCPRRTGSPTVGRSAGRFAPVGGPARPPWSSTWTPSPRRPSPAWGSW